MSSRTHISFLQFRRFVSLVVQRLAGARDLMRLRLVFTELAGGKHVLTPDDLDRLPDVIGASVLDSADIKTLVSRSNQNGGTLAMKARMYGEDCS